VVGFDTNILIYAADGAAGHKHERSTQLLSEAIARRRAFLPAQVLAEFAHVRIRKLGAALQDTVGFINGWMGTSQVESYRPEDIDRALEAHGTHHLPFWDALLWAVCDRAGVTVLASEDFQNGRRLGRVTFLDPFDPANDRALGLG
jgi:predicted nucleic acid-binding protein